jgi:hypothetical protein
LEFFCRRFTYDVEYAYVLGVSRRRREVAEITFAGYTQARKAFGEKEELAAKGVRFKFVGDSCDTKSVVFGEEYGSWVSGC